MNNPLAPDPVRPLKRDMGKPEPQDNRPFWKRFLTSLRPSVGIETGKKTGKRIGTLEIKGHADF